LTRVAGTLFVFLIGFAFSGGQAQAGCGDDHFALPPMVDGHPAPTPIQPPCHGPNCSAQREEREPLLPVRTSATTQAELWARLHTELDAPPLPECWATITSPSVVSIHRPLDIFHPPRLG